MGENNNGCCRIVLTGGPGAGKTTAADMFRREIGDSIVVVPEAATLLFNGGFPRVRDTLGTQKTQAAIYHTQKNLEDIQTAEFPGRILLCDRGTVDSAVYWPDGAESFFDQVGSGMEQELGRYDAVLFFETAAAGGIAIEGGNPTRIESIAEARELDSKLQKVWRQHPSFHFVPHQTSFFAKISSALEALQNIVTQLRGPKA